MFNSRPKATAVIVTRGDVQFGDIAEQLDFHFDDVVVWNNSHVAADMKVFGRYLAIDQASEGVIYTQDDDCLVDVPAVLQAYRDQTVVANLPKAWRGTYFDGISLVGFGSVFHRDLVRRAFDRYLKRWPIDDLFLRECDRVFTALNQVHRIDVAYWNTPDAEKSDRMGKEDRHRDDLREIRERLKAIL